MKKLFLKSNIKEERVNLKSKLNSFLMKKNKGFDWIIGALILAAIGVGLGIYFRNEIYALITSAVTSMKGSIENLLTGAVKA